MIEPRPSVARFELAERRAVARAGRVMRLGHNERTVSLPAEVVADMLARVDPEELTAIPELEPFYTQLARFLGMPRPTLLACHGADAGIAQVFQAYVREGDEVVQAHPSYHRYPQLTAVHGARAVAVSAEMGGRARVDALLEAITPATRLVALDNPSGTTGSALAPADLRAVAEHARHCGALLLVDEVYHHFCDITALPLVLEFGNVVVARSFSKAFGIAGVRVGALVAEPDVLRQLAKVGPRHEIGALAARVAGYLLEHSEVMEDYVAAVRDARERLGPALAPLGFSVAPSQSACVLARLPEDLDRDALVRGLGEAGVEIAGALPPPYERCVRVTVGPWRQMESFVATLSAVVAGLRDGRGRPR